MRQTVTRPKPPFARATDSDGYVSASGPSTADHTEGLQAALDTVLHVDKIDG